MSFLNDRFLMCRAHSGTQKRSPETGNEHADNQSQGQCIAFDSGPSRGKNACFPPLASC